MVPLLEDFKNLLSFEKSLFWGYVFGFVDYNTFCDKVFNIKQGEIIEKEVLMRHFGPSKEPELKSQLTDFIMCLEKYRCETNPKSFQQLDFEQILRLSENSRKDNIPSFCVLLDKKRASNFSLDTLNQSNTENLEQSPLDSEESSLSQGSEFDKLQKQCDERKFSFIKRLCDLDRSFFYYVQICYTLICQATFNCFKVYIQKRAEDLADEDKAFSVKNLTMFSLYGNDKNRKNERALQFTSPYKNEEFINEVWQEELKDISFFNFYGYDCSNIFKQMFLRLENEIEAEESKLLIVDLESFPLPNLFWNCSNSKPWKYYFKVYDFRSSEKTYTYPAAELEKYYQPYFDPWGSEDFEYDPDND